MTILQGNKRFVESQFDSESDLEELVRNQSKFLFGKDTIFVPKRKLKKELKLGNTVPDGFLFDLADVESPEFYIVEVELQEHDFHRHINSQVTKFIGFFHNSASQNDLAENLFSIINADTTLKSEFKKHLKKKELFKFLKDIFRNSQNILLIIDGEKEDLQEINRISKDWGKFVKMILTVKKFTNKNETLVTVEPDFMDFQKMPGIEILEAEHLSKSQLAMCAAELSTGRNSQISTVEAAKKLKASRDSVEVAKKILRVSPALAKLVKSGKMTLNKAEMKIANLIK